VWWVVFFFFIFFLGLRVWRVVLIGLEGGGVCGVLVGGGWGVVFLCFFVFVLVVGLGGFGGVLGSASPSTPPCPSANIIG